MASRATLCGMLIATTISHAGANQNPFPVSEAGSFKDPSAAVRPKFRYWIPDASIDSETLASDIAQLGDRGAGGIEFLNYFNYGGAQGPPPKEIDWNIYGYATPKYREMLEAALLATADHKMIMDFCMGPQSGQGVPAEPDEIGLAWELVTFNASLIVDYRGQIPGWGSGDFISASAFDIIETGVIPALTRPESNKTQYIVSSSSMVDLTSLAFSNGSISLGSLDMNITDSTRLFASYARRSFARASIATSERQENILQNGSFAVDHFSRTGAKLTTSFLQTHVIQPNSTIRALFEKVGQYMWEDSPEIPTPIYWTPGILSIFEQQHGYDIRKYIPFLTGFNGDLMLNDPPISIVSNNLQDSVHVDNFRSTMTFLYQEYLAELKNWSNDYLGMQFSAQAAYNLPVDMLSSIPSVDVPETETLAFLNNVDAFRQFSGAAYIAGRKVVSIELGADYGQAYSQPLALLIEEASRAYAVGVNQVVIHGASYSGYYPQTTYPGFAVFGYTFGAHHSRHQPAWNLGYKQALDWLARVQFVLQAGTPKVDVVVWNKQTAQDPFPDSLYQRDDLSAAGYAYTYLSPDNFALPLAVVKDGLFAPQTLGAKVLLLRHSDTLTTFGVEKLAEYVSSGLLLVIEGRVPEQYSSSDVSAVASANSTLHSMLCLPNVHQITSDSSQLNSTSNTLTTLLKSLNVEPRTSIQTDGVWYTRYLSSPTAVFIFSDTNNATEGTISVMTIGIPYLLNPWNGVRSPILEYQLDAETGTVTIPMKLAAKQAVLIQFEEVDSTLRETGFCDHDIHVTNAPENVLGYVRNTSTKSIFAKFSSSNGSNQITLSDNTTVKIDLSASDTPKAFNLTNWTLVAEKWVPPSNLSEYDGVVKERVALMLQGSQITPWPYLEGLANSSGIGNYTATFSWPPADSGVPLGAFIQIPATRLIQGMTVSVNGYILSSIDLFDPKLDITQFIQHGSNIVSICVSTSLWNSLRPVWNLLRTGGAGPQMTIESLLAREQTQPLGIELPIGLSGSVQIIPYQTVKLN